MIQTDWDALYLMDKEYIETTDITVEKSTWNEEQVLGIHKEELQWEDNRMEARIAILTAMLIIRERQHEIRMWVLNNDSTVDRTPEDTRRMDCMGNAMYTRPESQQHLRENAFIKDITKLDWRPTDTDTHKAKLHMVFGSILESNIVQDNPGLWEEMREITGVIKPKDMYNIMQAYAQGQTSLRPCNLNETVEREQDKEIGKDRQRIQTQGRGIQYTAKKNEAQDAGEHEKESNREVIKRENQELKIFANNLYKNLIWKRVKQKLCTEMQIRKRLQEPTEETKNTLRQWEMTAIQMAKTDGNRWYETQESQIKFRGLMEEQIEGSYTTQLGHTVQRKQETRQEKKATRPRTVTEGAKWYETEESQIRFKERTEKQVEEGHTTQETQGMLKSRIQKQTLKQRALMGPRYLPINETNDRMRSILDDLGYSRIHEQGMETRHTNTGEVVHLTVPNRGSLQYATNVYGNTMKSNTETCGNMVPQRRQDNIAPILDDIYLIQTGQEDYTRHEGQIENKRMIMEPLSIGKRDVQGMKLRFQMEQRQDQDKKEGRDLWVARIIPEEEESDQFITQNVSIIYKESQQEETEIQLTYTEQWKKRAQPNEDTFASGNLGTTWYGCLQLDATDVKDEGKDNSN